MIVLIQVDIETSRKSKSCQLLTAFTFSKDTYGSCRIINLTGNRFK